MDGRECHLFCSSAEDQLSKTGQSNDKIQLYLKQAETLEFVESYVRNNGFEFIVVDLADGKTIINTFENWPEPPQLIKLESQLYSVYELEFDEVKYDVFGVAFEPWQWKLLFYKGRKSYDDLVTRIMAVYFAFGVLVITVCLLVFLFLRQLSLSQKMLMESEFNMKSTLDALAEGVLVLDGDGKVFRVNPSASRILGLSSGAKVVGQHVIEILRLQSNHTGRPVTKEGYENGGKQGLKDVRNEEFFLTNSLGETRTVSLSGASFAYNRGEKPQNLLVLSFYDVTQFKETEKKLQQAKRMETVGLMAGGVAHDLNNSLSGVVTYPQILLRKLDEGSDLREPLQTILDSGKRAAGVVDDLLTVARGAASIREVANLNDLINSFLLQPEYEKIVGDYQSVSVSVNLASDLPNISCSPVHVNKCLMNLLINAFDSLGEGGNCLLTTEVVEFSYEEAGELELEAGRYCVVSVEDSGSGILPEDIQHIFEPFYTKKKMGKSGTGLGLSVVWNTMQDHQGGVTVESDQSCTRFSLFFPVSSKAVSGGEKDVRFSDITGKGEVILVIDDENHQLEITSEVLTTLNYRPVSVSSGEEALKYLKESAAEVIILDMVMKPGLSGYETYKEICSFKPGQKAIVVSGFSRSEDVKNTMQLGAEVFLKKPYTIEQLGIALKKVL